MTLGLSLKVTLWMMLELTVGLVLEFDLKLEMLLGFAKGVKLKTMGLALALGLLLL